ncbi:MAG: DUF2785 domain-containing protein [Woeseiaceae bacterium]
MIPTIKSIPYLGRAVLLSLAAIALQATWSAAAAAGIDCLDTSTALSYWRPIRKATESHDSSVDDLALELTPCLGSPDPELRDQIAYELYVEWLRNDRLSDATKEQLLGQLSSLVRQPGNDSSLARSFSALILAELMRADANRAFMSPEQRQHLLSDAIEALQREDDFRGLVADIGWVHPVAHLSDLLWRFALHPETTPAQGMAALTALRSKVSTSQASYTFNESDRMARVVSALFQRQLLEVQDAAVWIEAFAVPATMEKWSDAFLSPEGMAELHNTKQFLRALSDQLNETDVADAIRDPLEALVQGFTRLI